MMGFWDHAVSQAYKVKHFPGLNELLMSTEPNSSTKAGVFNIHIGHR